MTIPFALRLLRFAEGVILPTSLVTSLAALPAFTRWTEHCFKLESVMYVWEEEKLLQGVRERLDLAKEKYAN